MKNRFRVGDRVKIVGGLGEDFWDDFASVKGKIATITSKEKQENGEYFYFLDQNRYRINFEGGWLKPVLLKNKSKEKLYTISTYLFDSLKEAEKQITEWNRRGELREGTTVFEINKVYKPHVKLVEEK